MSGRRVIDATLPLRLRTLFGSVGVCARLMVALDRGHSSTEAILAGRNAPPEILWIVECLEAMPVERWPSRWRSARGADAPKHYPAKTPRGQRWSDAALAEARSVIRAGGTTRAASAASGIPYPTLNAMKARGVMPRPSVAPHRPMSERTRHALEMLRNDVAPRTIAATLNITKQRVSQIRKQWIDTPATERDGDGKQ
mgnify:CR=1 FL=1